MNGKAHITAFWTLRTIFLIGLASGQSHAADDIKILEVGKQTPKLEVRTSQIGYRDTLLFYTFHEQHAVLKLQIGNKDTTFPVSTTIYVFADNVTEEGLKRWLNNQHSDGLFVDVPEPVRSHRAPAKVAKISSHKFMDHSKQPFGEFDNYAVTFKVNDYSGMEGVKLKGFTGETKVHVKTN